MQQRITWLAAFKILGQGKPEVLGKSYKGKKAVLIGALISTLLALFYPPYLINLYSGSNPPEAPVIKAIGTFSTIPAHNLSGAATTDVKFATEDGREYFTRNSIPLKELTELVRAKPLCKVYTEGFLLQNGKGSFWPILVKNIDGDTLISKDKLQTIYNFRRTKLPIKVGLLIFLILGVPCWLGSIFIAYKIKHTL
jgi:hypothetical protein